MRIMQGIRAGAFLCSLCPFLSVEAIPRSHVFVHGVVSQWVGADAASYGRWRRLEAAHEIVGDEGGGGYLLSELDRRLKQMIRIGVVHAVDPVTAKVQVCVGQNTTDWRPWLAVAGTIKTWNPPAVGEQVLVLSPGGDFEQSVVVPSLYYTAFKAPSNDSAERCIALSAESRATWNAEKHQLGLQLEEGGAFVFEVGDQSVRWDKEALVFTHKGASNHPTTARIEDSHIALQSGNQQVNLGPDGVRVETPHTSITSADSVITLQAGGQMLELTPQGLFLNGMPLGGL